MTQSDRVQISKDGETFVTRNRGIPRLTHDENGRGGQCQVAIDDNLVFIAGGYNGAEMNTGSMPRNIMDYVT